MAVEFTTPLAVNKCKLNDVLSFSIDENTPSDFNCVVYDLNGNTIYTPGNYSISRNEKLYWFVEFSEANGFDELEYYQVVISDEITGGLSDTVFIVYVGNQANFDSYIIKAMGLAGHNIRKYDHVWVNGLLTEYKVSIYATLALLEQAESGGTDTPLETYLVSITYDSNYNKTQVTSIKQ